VVRGWRVDHGEGAEATAASRGNRPEGFFAANGRQQLNARQARHVPIRNDQRRPIAPRRGEICGAVGGGGGGGSIELQDIDQGRAHGLVVLDDKHRYGMERVMRATAAPEGGAKST
jgi:hypothetical protein